MHKFLCKKIKKTILEFFLKTSKMSNVDDAKCFEEWKEPLTGQCKFNESTNKSAIIVSD